MNDFGSINQFSSAKYWLGKFCFIELLSDTRFALFTCVHQIKKRCLFFTSEVNKKIYPLNAIIVCKESIFPFFYCIWLCKLWRWFAWFERIVCMFVEIVTEKISLNIGCGVPFSSKVVITVSLLCTIKILHCICKHENTSITSAFSPTTHSLALFYCISCWVFAFNFSREMLWIWFVCLFVHACRMQNILFSKCLSFFCERIYVMCACVCACVYGYFLDDFHLYIFYHTLNNMVHNACW